MKYTDRNLPLKLLLTNSTCYKGTGKMKPCGVLIHDTGAVNPNLKRYIQPTDDDPEREKWLEMLGRNQYNNDYNHQYRKMGVNAWIGMLADGTVTTIQTLLGTTAPGAAAAERTGPVIADGYNLRYAWDERRIAYISRLHTVKPAKSLLFSASNSALTPLGLWISKE